MGITGGIGCGKSTVCQAFSLLGIPVFYTDRAAIDIYRRDHIKEQLIRWFGDDIYLTNRELDRKKLAKIIFNDNFALERINGLIHPAVFDEFNKWCDAHSDAPYVIQESAILFESEQANAFDHIIVATAPLDERISRTMKRDNTSLEKIEERMRNQMDDKYKMELADDIVVCDNSHYIIHQVITIDRKLKLKWQNLENG